MLTALPDKIKARPLRLPTLAFSPMEPSPRIKNNPGHPHRKTRAIRWHHLQVRLPTNHLKMAPRNLLLAHILLNTALPTLLLKRDKINLKDSTGPLTNLLTG